MNKIKLFIAALGAGLILAVIILLVALGEADRLAKNFKAGGEIKLPERIAALVKTNDFNKCGELKDEPHKTVCLNNIALNLAGETGEISYCQKLDDKLIRREDCARQVIFTQALAKEDVNICRQAPSEELQKQCQESFPLRLALKKDDISVCGREQEKDRADFCRDNFLISKNFSQNPEEFNCSSLKSIAARPDCENIKQFIGKKDIGLCANLKTELFLPYCL